VNVRTGLDCCREDGFSILKGKRFALVAHPASVDSALHHILDLVLASGNGELVRVFGPEHGVKGTAQDMEAVSAADGRIEEVSLYGDTEESLYPKPEQLSDLDLVVVDLQDVGARYYTYAQTLYYLMEVAAKTETQVVVLDRPNPIGGLQIEGSGVSVSCRSFCGLFDLPNRHGLTIGELAKLMNAGFGEEERELPALNCALEVIPMQGWKREMYFDETGLPWVLPSPNMPTLDTAIVYPGTCLFEASGMSEARGTTKPFELLGAPYVDAEKWITAFIDLGGAEESLTLRPCSFKPMYQKHEKQICEGLQLHVQDRKRFNALKTGLLLVAAAKGCFEQFRWRSGSYEFIETVPAIDLLYGSEEFRQVLENTTSLEPLFATQSTFEQRFLELRIPTLLY